MWCLSCFFVSACSHSQWLQAYFPHLQLRFGYFEHEDKKLFCLAAREFYSSLDQGAKRDKFRQAFQAAAQPGSPYYDLLQML